MKKVLLSFLLLLLCSIRSLAEVGTETTVKCFEYIDGKYVIKVKVGNAYLPHTNSLHQCVVLFVKIGGNYIGSFVETGEVQNLLFPNDWDLTYEIDDPYDRLNYDCIEVAYKWYDPEDVPSWPDEPTSTAYQTICPCEGSVRCDANFTLCMSYDEDANEYKAFVNPDNYYSWNTYEVDFGEPGSYQYGVPAVYTFTSTGNKTICVYGKHAASNSNCYKCINICLPAEPKNGQNETSVKSHSASFGKVELYPNPANNTSTLKFQIEKQEHVTIKVFGINGQVIREISNETMASGHHSVEINTGDLPSGVYVISLETPAATSHYRLSVIK
jgi:hypothetical protein